MKLADRIIPVPQNVTEGENILEKNMSYRLVCDLPGESSLGQRAARRLEQALQTALTGNGQVLTVTLTMGDAPEEIPNPDQGYSIHAEKGSVTITGFGDAGVYYAVTTFLQCLHQEDGAWVLPAMDVLDYPLLKTRGHFMETRYGTDCMELEDWKQVVDFMEDHKENQLTVSVYGCWQVQFDNRVSEYVFAPFKNHPELKTPVFRKYYSPAKKDWVDVETLAPMYEKDFLGELMAYGRERGIQVVPMMNSLGHNTLIPRLYPEVSAKDENGEPTLTGYCTSNPKTYELLFALYDEIIDRYAAPNGVDAFDIGMDEVRDGRAFLAGDVGRLRSPWCKCPECAKKTRGQIIIDHAIRQMQHLKEKGMRTVYMYNDMVMEHKTAPGVIIPEDRTAMFCQALEKKGLMDVACLDWWSYRQLRETFHFETIHPELGLRGTLKPWNGYYNWAFHVTAVRNNYHISRMALAENAEGMRSYSTWDNGYHRNNQTQADYAWNHKGTGRPQSATARYVRRHFPTAQSKANSAFLLMDDVLRFRDEKSINNVESSRHEVLMHELVAYHYTYYRRDQDYPRNFPGEKLPKLRENAEFVGDLELVCQLTEQAAKLFGEVAETPGCDKTLAELYKYEMEHVALLCKDFLTLKQLDELAQAYENTKDKAFLAKLAEAAAAQKNARLAHLADMENVKDSYVIPGSGRVQSIPMQYFADIEKYVTETPAEALKLDFTDMRHAASQRFHWLR
ncbi:MAG: family 20 glycosylhydrolase [Oscillospiraceae bacterium]|nr:family 20 glycosylhydrolase [Oscillospiraceae bacterium]